MTHTRPRSLPWTSVPVVLLVLLVLTGLKLQQLVDFLRDAQYYVQASQLWPRGEVGFAGSLIGSRDLVVLVYHGAMTLLGESTDALGVAMAALFAFGCLLLTVVCFASLRGAVARTVAAIAAAFCAFVLTAWSYPASDGPGVVALVAMWAIWAAWLKWRRPWLLWLLLPLVAGLSTHVRSELTLFALILGVAAAAPLLLGRGAGRSRPRVIAATAAAVGIFAIGASAPNLAWPLWVPAEKPYAYTKVFLFYRAFDELARGSNGEASSEVARTLGLRPEDKLPFWQALGRTYVTHGARESDRLLARAAVEGLRAAPSQFAEQAALTLCAEICNGGPAYPVVSLERGQVAERRARQLASLVDLDAVRKSHSAQFGNDPVFPTAELAKRSIPWVEYLRERAGAFEATIRLPFLAAPMLALLLIAVAALRPAQRGLLIPVAAYALALFAVVSVMQGGIVRYLEGVVLMQVVALVIAVLAMFDLDADERPGG